MKYMTPIRISTYIVLLILALGCANAGAKTQVTIDKIPGSGLLSWSAVDDGFSIKLIQLLPDFVRAVYAKHGLPAKEYNEIGDYCVFGTIIKNTSGKTLDYDVGTWRTIDDKGTEGVIKTKNQWAEQWRKAGVNFSWTLLPGEGTFYPGDWQQGLSLIHI